MPFNKKSAKAAAKKRWKANQQPTYGKLTTTGTVTPKQAETYEVAAELPITVNALAGGMPKWEDPILELDADAYVNMRRCIPYQKAIRKLAIRTAKLNWTIVDGRPEAMEPKPKPKPVLMAPPAKLLAAEDMPGDTEPTEGGDPASQTRAEAVAEIFAQMPGWYSFIEHCTGSLVEGMRPYQIKTSDARVKQGADAWKVPNFYMGGRHRYNAGGDIEWDGRELLVQVEKTTGVVKRKSAPLPWDQFAIHRPGAGSNPEGDLDLGVAFYNGVVKPWNRAIISGDLWVRLFAIPAVLAGAKIEKARPDRINAMLDDRAAQIQRALENQGSVTALNNDELVRLLQADPSGLSGMVAWLQYLEGVADDLLTMGALLSSSGIGQADRTGNTQTQAGEKDDAAFANGVLIAETFNRHVLPWIIARNPNLPELEEGEQEVYLWPENPTEGDEQDVSVENEDVDTAPEEEPEPAKAMGLSKILAEQQDRYMRFIKGA